MKLISTLFKGALAACILFGSAQAQTLTKNWSDGENNDDASSFRETFWSTHWTSSDTYTATTGPAAYKLTRAVGSNMAYFPLQRSANNTFGGGGTYSWTVTSAPAGGVLGTNVFIEETGNEGTDNNDLRRTIRFTNAAPLGNYVIRVTRTNSNTFAEQTITLVESNFWAASGASSVISPGTLYAAEALNVSGGVFNSNPTRLFTTNTSFAAMGRGPFPTVPQGDFYYISNNAPNGGSFSLLHKNGDGSGGETSVLTYDVNGIFNNTSLGFVRLALDTAANAWLLAGDGSNLYLLKIPTNGSSNIPPAGITSYTVNISGGLASDFQNGDLCLDEQGNIYAMANANSSFAYLYLATAPVGPAVTFTKKWSILDASNNQFGGSVNGLAFDEFGGMYLSTTGSSVSSRDGIYYLNPSTLLTIPNSLSTVQATQIVSASNYTDLGTNVWPSFVLPVKFGNISAQFTDAGASVTWETYTENDILQYDVEMSVDGKAFNKVGTQAARNHNHSRQVYQQSVSLPTSNHYYFRVAANEINGKKSYSNVVVLSNKVKAENFMNLYPNPTSGQLLMHVNSLQDQDADILVHNMEGRLIARQHVQLHKGSNSIDFTENSRVLPIGTYHITVSGNDIRLTSKLLRN